MSVFLVCHGDGSDGDSWGVNAIFTTEQAAKDYITAHNSHRPKWAALRVEDIEEWAVDAPFDPSKYPHDKPKGPQW